MIDPGSNFDIFISWPSARRVSTLLAIIFVRPDI